MPKGRKPKPGQGKPKRQAAAKQARPTAAQADNAVGAKATMTVSSPDAASTFTLGLAPSPIGLVNLGHTCYFNAVLQVLTPNPHL